MQTGSVHTQCAIGCPKTTCRSNVARRATSIVDATALVIDAFSRCEQELVPRGPGYTLDSILEALSNGFNGHGEG